MIISENHFGKENCVAYCDVLIRRNYEVINADEHFYHFVEKLVGINFLILFIRIILRILRWLLRRLNQVRIVEC